MFSLQNFAKQLFSISLGRQCLCKILANPGKNVQLVNRPSDNKTRGRRSSGPARAICRICIGESSLVGSTLPRKASKIEEKHYLVSVIQSPQQKRDQKECDTRESHTNTKKDYWYSDSQRER